MLNVLNNIKSCRDCKLCNNQPPIIQPIYFADIFWVGLSAVKTTDKSDIPLSQTTNSGKLISTIEIPFQSKMFYRTNVVKCLPLENAKIRYPTTNEMKGCFFHLRNEIQFFKPKLVFLLGKQVASFVLKEFGINAITLNDEFNYTTFSINNCLFIPVHHPSFILVYRRKKMQEYINGIGKLISRIDKAEKTNFEHHIIQNELSGTSLSLQA